MSAVTLMLKTGVEKEETRQDRKRPKTRHYNKDAGDRVSLLAMWQKYRIKRNQVCTQINLQFKSNIKSFHKLMRKNSI